MSRSIVMASLIVVGALIGAGLRSDLASAATPVVEGSYNNAITFGNAFCADTGPTGVGPSYAGFGDLVWITAMDGSKNITFTQGTQYVSVQIHAAGKYCKNYNGTSPGSYYDSASSSGVLDGRLSGRINYVNGAPNTTISGLATGSLYVGDLTTGTKTIYMSLTSFFLQPDGTWAPQKQSPNAWTKLNITVKQQWNLSMADAHISEIDPVTKAIIKNYGLNQDVDGTPGKAYEFFYRWVNTGADSTDVTTYLQREYIYPSTGYVNSDPYVTKPAGVAGGGGWMYNGNPGWMTVQASDAGKSYCMKTSVYPGSSASAAKKSSPGYLCVNVASRFVLYPSVAMSTTSASPGQTISNIVGSINNSIAGGGSTISQPNTSWQLSEFIVKPGGTIPPSTGGYASPLPAPCTYFGNGGQNQCIDVASGLDQYNPGVKAYPASSITVPNDIEPGSQVCFAMSVNKYDGGRGVNDWLHSAVKCSKISKKPKMQVWGGDVRSQGKITTSMSTMGGAQFGSWVEYGALSAGLNTNFASGSALSGGSNASVPLLNQLTFANRTSYGSYAAASAIPNNTAALVAQFSAATPVVTPGRPAIGASSLSLTGMASGTYKLTQNNVTLSASVLKGTSIVLIAPASGTVTISGDITYQSASGTGTFTDPTKLPQLVIIAKTINILNTAGEVNAWLLTTTGGIVNTCSDVTPAANLRSALCNKPLVINGPVATDTLYLRRTAGSDDVASANAPAEVINLRADAYVWASSMITQGGRVQTDKIIEMAPRF